MACVAAPIRDASGACLATISVVLPADKVVRNRARYAKPVQESALWIEDRLGHRGRD